MINREKSILYVSNLEKSLAFYRDKLGFEVRVDKEMGPNARWLEVGPAGAAWTLVLFPRAATRDWQQRKASVWFGCADVEETYEKLLAKKVEFTQKPKPLPMGVVAMFVDPDDNEFVLTDA